MFPHRSVTLLVILSSSCLQSQSGRSVPYHPSSSPTLLKVVPLCPFGRKPKSSSLEVTLNPLRLRWPISHDPLLPRLFRRYRTGKVLSTDFLSRSHSHRSPPFSTLFTENNEELLSSTPCFPNSFQGSSNFELLRVTSFPPNPTYLFVPESISVFHFSLPTHSRSPTPRPTPFFSSLKESRRLWKGPSQSIGSEFTLFFHFYTVVKND